jgi:organic hydroperoxide reductase OsmC/OhrA
MPIVETLRFPVRSHWFGGRLLRVGAPEKPDLRIGTPPEFQDGVAGIWSPEDLLVGALASCYELTLLGMAELCGVPVLALDVSATGLLERSSGVGGDGLTVIELDVELATDPEHELELEQLARTAQERCSVWRALEVPVRLRVESQARSREAVPA